MIESIPTELMQDFINMVQLDQTFVQVNSQETIPEKTEESIADISRVDSTYISGLLNQGLRASAKAGPDNLNNHIDKKSWEVFTKQVGSVEQAIKEKAPSHILERLLANLYDILLTTGNGESFASEKIQELIND